MKRSDRARRGTEIRDMRLRLGLTQAVLGESAGVSTKTVRNIEKGDTVGQEAKIDAIVDALLRANADQDGFKFEDSVPRTVVQYMMTVAYVDGREITLRVPDANTLDDFIERFMAKPEVATVSAEPEFFDRDDVENESDFAVQRWMRQQLAQSTTSAAEQQSEATKDELATIREARAAEWDSIEGHEPPMDAAAHSTGQESAKERMMREQDEDAERQ